MTKIRVGRRNEEGAYYIGRPSPLGNPYILSNESSRDMICDLYGSWLMNQIQAGNTEVIEELKKIKQLADRPEGVVLGCYCSPKRCHGDEIKEVIENDKYLLFK